jgi:hypothetical protein
MCDRVRPWTPYLLVTDGPGGQLLQEAVPKRQCNACGTWLGDATDEERHAPSLNQELPDVRNECPFCQRSAKRNV